MAKPLEGEEEKGEEARMETVVEGLGSSGKSTVASTNRMEEADVFGIKAARRRSAWRADKPRFLRVEKKNYVGAREVSTFLRPGLGFFPTPLIKNDEIDEFFI